MRLIKKREREYYSLIVDFRGSVGKGQEIDEKDLLNLTRLSIDSGELSISELERKTGGLPVTETFNKVWHEVQGWHAKELDVQGVEQPRLPENIRAVVVQELKNLHL